MLVNSTDGQSGQKFTWTQRIAAAIGVAKGLLFLHTGIVPGVYSNRLKITDVLLDHDLHVKIKKFNLPLLTENRKSVSEKKCSFISESSCLFLFILLKTNTFMTFRLG